MRELIVETAAEAGHAARTLGGRVVLRILSNQIAHKSDAAELFKDTSLRMRPASGGLRREDAFDMARALKTWPLLDGYRGGPKADTAALVSAIVAFSNMAAHLGDRLVEAEINPLFVLPAGEGGCAADGVLVLR